MLTPLLDRQVELLDYLTSGNAIFGNRSEASRGQVPLGMEIGLLRLEARFSHQKRMAKITELLPNTFELLGTDRTAIVRAFVDACPSTHVGSFENARQFYDFLCTAWRDEPPEPPYLPDVAACEIARAQVRVGAAARLNHGARVEEPRSGAIRRPLGIVLLRCRYDVRPIFESEPEEAAPARRDTRLAIAISPDAGHPNVFDLPAGVFDMLSALENWTERSALGTAEEFDALLRELAQHGLIEVAP
jgi:hypothetical protein